MRTLLMMRTRGIVQPFVKNGRKPATVKKPSGYKSVGTYIVYKKNNP